MWAHLLVAVLGIWLMAAPDLLGFDDPAADVLHILGPIVASFGIMAANQVLRGLRYVSMLLGAALVVAPFVLGYPTDALLVSAVTGVAVGALSLVRGAMGNRLGGGWHALFD